MKHLRNKRKAFTLIELITVIAIMGIIASISASALKWYQPNLKLSAAARTLRADLANARLATVAEQKTHGIHVTQVQNQYEKILIENEIQTQATVTLPADITFQSVGPFTDDMVTFTAAGTPSATGTIVLQNSAGNTKTVTISPSGYVHSN